MKTFDYLVADNLDAAVAELNASKPHLKAGGIDLVDLMKERLNTPETVLSINNIKDLRNIQTDGEAIRIGSLTTLADIARSDLIREKVPNLYHAAARAATPQVRERATIGGNLCQRPRCWYFRSIDFHCLKKGGYMCFAVEGENQYHAIYGEGPCHIVHPSNIAPSLLALDADFVVRNADGERTIKARDFFVMPNVKLTSENVLEDGDVLTEVVIPKAPEQSATIELREKQSFDWPIMIASAARVDGAWSVCLGAAAPVPWLSKPAMDVLGKQDITETLAAQAGEAAASEAKPLADNGYKVQLVKVAVKRALLSASGMEVPA